jgi:hypothetical protein
MQWVVDLWTTLVLFLILGRRWAILSGLIAEAIPGMGVFPFWVLVIFSIIFYDDVKGRKRALCPIDVITTPASRRPE